MARQPQRQQLNQIQQGVLRGSMQLELHTTQASRFWHGRFTRGIYSFPRYFQSLVIISNQASYDDPYADWYLLKIEQKIAENSAKLKELIQKIADFCVENTPENIRIEYGLNTKPATYPINTTNPYSYKLVYMLSDFDMYVRVVQTARHIALITNKQATDLIDNATTLIRNCLETINTFKVLGITRADMRQNNAVAKRAIQIYGKLPNNILNATQRAEYAPRINDMDTMHKSRFIAELNPEEDEMLMGAADEVTQEEFDNLVGISANEEFR